MISFKGGYLRTSVARACKVQELEQSAFCAQKGCSLTKSIDKEETLNNNSLNQIDATIRRSVIKKNR
jgi:hypothetical protein